MHRWSFLVEGCLVVTHVIIYLASSLPRGVSQGQLTSASGTSAAHFRDGCRGYRPGALCASIIGDMCREGRRRGAVRSQRGFLQEQLSHRAEVATSGTASPAVTVLNLAGLAASGAADPAESPLLFQTSVVRLNVLQVITEFL